MLAAFWLWNGVAYHWTFIAEINPAAYGFGASFVLQGILFAATALTQNSPRRYSGHCRLDLILYAAVIYELLGYAAGRIDERSPLRRCSLPNDHLHDRHTAHGE